MKLMEERMRKMERKMERKEREKRKRNIVIKELKVEGGEGKRGV